MWAVNDIFSLAHIQKKLVFLHPRRNTIDIILNITQFFRFSLLFIILLYFMTAFKRLQELIFWKKKEERGGGRFCNKWKELTGKLKNSFNKISLRIQPPFIRLRYYVRNAKKDVCDSPPEIPYWWRKSVLNPDRSADWLTEQFCIISSTIIQCCDVQKSNNENLSYPSFQIFRLCVQYVRPMFNISSLKESQAPRLFIVLSAVRRF